MLVLKRKVGEYLVIIHNGERLEVHVLGEDKIGILGELSFVVLRSELEKAKDLPPSML